MFSQRSEFLRINTLKHSAHFQVFERLVIRLDIRGGDACRPQHVDNQHAVVVVLGDDEIGLVHDLLLAAESARAVALVEGIFFAQERAHKVAAFLVGPGVESAMLGFNLMHFITEI